MTDVSIYVNIFFLFVSAMTRIPEVSRSSHVVRTLFILSVLACVTPMYAYVRAQRPFGSSCARLSIYMLYCAMGI